MDQISFLGMLQIRKVPKHVYNWCSRTMSHLFDLNLGVYWFWVGVRIYVSVIPQTGYIHPDEYFQTVEVLAGKAFDTEANIPWEFNSTFPIRSIPAIYLTMYIPLCMLKIFSEMFQNLFGISLILPYMILVVPRLSMCALSFVSDICLFKICECFGQNYKERLVMFASSFVCLVYMTRTFTNTIETLCFNLLLCLVALTIYDTEGTTLQRTYLEERYSKATTIHEKVVIKRLLKLVPPHTLKSCVPIAIVTVTGFFNRPTFLFFAIIPLFFWFQRGLTIRSIFLKEFHLRMFVFIIYCIPVVFFFIYFDSVYYGYITWGEILNFDIGFKNFVVTPLNFFRYNLDVGNLSKHGLHPRFLHILVNIPLMFNILGMSALVVVIKLLYRGTFSQWVLLPKSQSVTGMMTLGFIVPVVCLSVVPHQEPRFITPILLPLTFLYSHIIRNFQEDYQTVVPFRKRHRKRINVPAHGIMRYPLKCIAFLSDAISTIDNRYILNGQYLAELQQQALFESARRRYESRNDPKAKRQPETVENLERGRVDLIRTWYFLNLVCILFFGYLHQGGVFGLARDIHNRLAVKPRYTTYHLVTSHMYPFPLHLLSLKKNYKSKNTNFSLYELGSDKQEKFNEKLTTIIKLAEATKKSARRNYKIYVALPTTLFNDFILNSPWNYAHKILNVYYPHISTEALPSIFMDHIPYDFCDRFAITRLLDFHPFDKLFRFLHQFTLMLVEIELPEPE